MAAASRSDCTKMAAASRSDCTKMAAASRSDCTKMAATSRMEVNLSRLLLQCEKMAAAEECDDSNWRYEQYVKALQSQYDVLKSSPSAPGADKLSDFGRRIEHLRSFLPVQLPPVITPAVEVPGRPASSPPAAPSPALPAPVSSGGGGGARTSPPLAELRHRRGGRAHAQARAQLLGTSAAAAPSTGDGSTEDDFEKVMKRHHEMQERAAEEMLALTRNLKEQSLIAKNVIAKDRETLERSTTLTDKNTGRLERESQRLAEFSRRACRCWLWIMLAVVCATFMGMVMFIRLFGKKMLPTVPDVPAAAAP